jgi:hypothetical protein
VIAPSVSVNHPKIVVTPNEPDNKDRAVFVEAVINHLWKHHDFRKPFRRAVKDFLIFGHSWVKVGWKFLEQERTLGEAERAEMFDEAVLETDRFAMEDPLLAGGLPTDEEMAANIPQTAMMVVEDQPFVERISHLTCTSTRRRPAWRTPSGLRSGLSARWTRRRPTSGTRLRCEETSVGGFSAVPDVFGGDPAGAGRILGQRGAYCCL